MKKYFLKDTTLNSVDDDQFRYQDFANNLRNILECNNTPFNIAIVGKWGLGKSSLINMALAPLRKKENEYLVCDINAWKYEKDEIGKAFLKELYECISKQKILSFKFFHKDYDKLVKDSLKEESTLDRNTNLFKFLKYVVIILVLSLVAFFGYCKLSNDFYGIQFTKGAFWKSSLLRYCKNIGSILIIPLVVWLGKLFMDKMNVPTNRSYEISFPLETQADYEIYLRELLDKYCSKNPNKKIVVTVDDLDRLSAEKIVEALDALKIFMEYDEIIFIVPFDDEILKNALDKNKLKKINDSNNRYDGDMVLDKLFQYKIYLPQLIKSDMRNYAFKICKEGCSDFVKEFCNDNQGLFEEIVGKILIHNSVSTPRQVKKIINTFIENVMVSRDRELANRVSNGFATEKKGLETIAKISVLQADYNGFYDILFDDTNAINEILDVHRNGAERKPSQLIEKYFDENEQKFVLKREYDSLVNFLSFTENLGHSSITPYLYMAQTEAGVLVGDQKQQDFMATIESCNFVTARQLLQDSPVLVDVLIEQLKYDETLMMGNMVISAIECFDIIEADKRESLAKSISDRIKSITAGRLDFRYDLLNVQNLMDVSRNVDDLQYNDLIAYALKLCQGEENKEKLIRKISNIKDELSENTHIKFEQFIREWITSEDSSIEAILEFVSNENVEYIASTYGINYIERVTKHITENDDFEDDIVSQFGNVLKAYLKKNSITTIEDMLEPCFDYPAMHEILNVSVESSSFEKMRNSKNVADKIISIGTDKLKDESGYEILAKLSYVIDSDENKIYDDFFLEIIHNSIFAKIVLAFAKKNSLENLPNTVKKLVENAFNSQGFSEDVRLLLKNFSSSQAEQFWAKMKTECAYSSNKDYSIITDLLLQLEKEEYYVEKLSDIINQVIIANLKTYNNKDNYLKFAVQVLSDFKKNMDTKEMDIYSSLLLKSISTDTNCVLNAYRNVHLYISDTLWCSNVTTLLSYISKSTYPIIYDIIISRIELFTKGNNNLDQLVTFLVDYIEMSDNPDDVINRINNLYSRISNLGTLIHNIMDISIDEENASDKLAKFIDDLTISRVVQIIINECGEDSNRKSKVLKIFSKSQKYSSEMILGNVNKFKSEISKANIMIILSLYETDISGKNIADFLEIAEYLKVNYFEKDVCAKILQIIAMIPKNIIDIKKDLVCLLVTGIFKDATSDEVKKKCAILIKEKNLSQKARGVFSKEQLTEYKSYLSE